MKHPNRIRKNTTTKTARVQPPVGQQNAESGHEEIRKQAIALVAEWESETIEQFQKSAIHARLRGSLDDMQSAASAADRPEEKTHAEKFLPHLMPLMKSLGIEDKNISAPQAKTPSLTVEEIERCDAWTLHEDSVRALIALQQLMFNAIEHENARLFMNDNGYLAAGLQTLMWESNARLQEAEDAVRKATKS
jgi:hypothetical protein